MSFIKRFFNFYSILVLSVFLYTLSLLVTFENQNFSLRWISFFLWIFSLLPPFVYLTIKKILSSPKKIISVKKGELLIFLLIVFIATSTRFILLKNYPFVAIGDEVRDGGWNARQILDGTIKNIFGYGRYDAHGLIIPTLITPFVFLFKNSVFSYRLPAAIISILDILLLFVFAKKLIGLKFAFFASLILINLPLDLFFARTEIVIIFSCLLTTVILFLSYKFIEEKRLEYLTILGLSLGFASGFHASIRTVVLFVLILTSGFIFYRYFKHKEKGVILKLFLLVIFYFVGFGPRLFFTTSKIFFHTNRLVLTETKIPQKDHSNFLSINEKIDYRLILKNYSKSIRGYLNFPALLLFSREFQPILSPFLSLFFVIGLLNALFFTKNYFLRIIAFLIFYLSFFNSAITDCVNCGHRISPTFPSTALITALGIEIFLKKLEKKLVKKSQLIFFIIMLVVGIGTSGILFFKNESASKGKSFQNYLSMYLLYKLQEIPQNQELCLNVSSQNIEYLNLLHVQELYNFMLPDTNFLKKEVLGLQNNEIYVSTKCGISDKQFVNYQYCQEKQKFVCPLDYEKPLNILIDKSLAKNNNLLK